MNVYRVTVAYEGLSWSKTLIAENKIQIHKYIRKINKERFGPVKDRTSNVVTWIDVEQTDIEFPFDIS